MEGADLQIHRFPQSKSIDAVRFLPPPSVFDRRIVAAFHEPDSDSFSVEIHALDPQIPSDIHLQSSWSALSRISALRVSQTPQKPLIAASTLAGTLHLFSAHAVEASIELESSIADRSFHAGPISGIDLQGSGTELVSVGEDGRVNLVSVGAAGLSSNRVFDSRGLVSYKTVRWASPWEFVTGGLGYSLQWWDQRRPGGPVSQFKGNWYENYCVCCNYLLVLSLWDLDTQMLPVHFCHSDQIAAHISYFHSYVMKIRK